MIIRAYQLKAGDVFERTGMKYKVIFVTRRGIHYRHLSDSAPYGHQGRCSEIGRRSQERLQLINHTGSGHRQL